MSERVRVNEAQRVVKERIEWEVFDIQDSSQAEM